MHGITNYIFVDEDKHIVSEIGFLDDEPAENFCGQLSVDLKVTITCYKEVCVSNYESVDERSPTLREAVAPKQPCPQCAGSGRVQFNSGRRYPCGKCNGTGQV